MVMKKVFGKTIATPSWQEAQKLADAKQAKQEAKAETKQEAKGTTSKPVKILGIEETNQTSVNGKLLLKASLDNGKVAFFDKIDLAIFEHIEIVGTKPKIGEIDMQSIAKDSFTADLCSQLHAKQKTLTETACKKILDSHHISEPDFVKFLVDHSTTDHA